jgi:FkbM family methyltransferase
VGHWNDARGPEDRAMDLFYRMDDLGALAALRGPLAAQPRGNGGTPIHACPNAKHPYPTQNGGRRSSAEIYMRDSALKRWLRLMARHWRVDLVHKPLSLLEQPDAQLDFRLEYAIAHFLLSRDAITFVQVGANDGQTHDPLNALLDLMPYRGIMLEPQPEGFRRLQETYKDHPQLTLVNAAISDRDEIRPLYCIRANTPGPAWITGVASFDRAHLLQFEHVVPDISRYIDEASVECITFETLFKRAPLDHVDLLQIDTEGYDAEVLRLFNVALRKPSIVNFEHAHLPESKWNECVQSLIRLDYKIAITGPDTLGYLVPAYSRNRE